MKYLSLLFTLIATLLGLQPLAATEFAITMDDPNLYSSPRLSPFERDARIRDALAKSGVHALLFTCGMRIDSLEGKALLQRWSDAGHAIGNHSYFHHNYGARGFTASTLIAEIEKTEALIRGLAGFARYFRFPFLKEGNTREKREAMRQYLAKNGYQNGAVSIDASDWYISDRLVLRLKKNPRASLEGYRDFYLSHLWERAQFYDGLARKLLGRSPHHTLLVHHNLLNALFLPEVITMFRAKGWTAIDATTAFEDEVYRKQPEIVPAGESLIWALAKETGKYDAILRYPGEDSVYEAKKMDRLGL